MKGHDFVDNYLLSVIIPTKDRYQYLKECVKTLIDINSDRIEIVIQDNTENNLEIVEYISTMDSSHIRYFHTRESLTVTENSERAVMHSTGDYVCFIGDDDSVSEIIIDVVEVLKRNSIDACNVNMAGYYWNDVESDNNQMSRLSYNNRRAKVRKVDTKKVLRKYLKTGMQEMLLLPRLYHGIVSRRLLEQVKTKSGSFFPGPSPDMANAAVAALLLEWHLFIGLPVIVSGASHKSAAGKGVRGAHKGKLSNMAHLPEDIEETWNPLIPKLWLMNTIWPETCLKALEKAGAYDYIELFNYYPIYARIWIKYNEYIPIVKEYLSSPTDYFMMVYAGVKEVTRWSQKRMYKKIRKWLRFESVYKEKLSLTDVCQIVNTHNKRITSINILENEIKKSISS